MPSLLKKRDERRLEERERQRHEVRERLKLALKELVPGETVLLFGSITRPYSFHKRSDVDIALRQEPRISRYRLQALLEDLIRCPVDLVILNECRFREKIEREGEAWTS
jgi:predicted nucleotidyltransferase